MFSVGFKSFFFQELIFFVPRSAKYKLTSLAYKHHAKCTQMDPMSMQFGIGQKNVEMIAHVTLCAPSSGVDCGGSLYSCFSALLPLLFVFSYRGH